MNNVRVLTAVAVLGVLCILGLLLVLVIGPGRQAPTAMQTVDTLLVEVDHSLEGMETSSDFADFSIEVEKSD